MAEVIIYRTQFCPYCDMAKRLFRELDVPFEEIDVTHDPDARAELIQRTGGKRTVPQIFINGTSVGGFTDVQALQRTGELTTMLGGE
ncbi:glutaredoxin 3 [Bradymonadaceae bacterium TMQ3]|uniref:Glutaredoxin n=1 Tax=Lujinxingia sediminis TaxID=2480984 RepID=A0ABY0CTT0_9DELT|nr:glutaredoxin 3 [Lujinxingia sediminis]RDV38857.1 glutaredoxin 3 [Bradymonadaceae bacterium TMQ3]RVU44091.1 glutaredoxin 3 [Lujinxingia sediminis]TXC76371.1 glutaredoxin 3 [Bradymonadales bacterium TMQ1]